MRKFLIGFAALAMLAAAPLVHAAQGKIGIVDVQYVLARSAAGQAVQAKLKSLSQEKSKALKARQKRLKQERQALQKNASIQSQAARKQSLKQFKSHLLDYRKSVKKSSASMAKQRRKLLQPLKATLYNVISGYADQHGYSMVLRKRIAVYFQDGRDLTNEILKAFNAAEAKQ